MPASASTAIAMSYTSPGKAALRGPFAWRMRRVRGQISAHRLDAVAQLIRDPLHSSELAAFLASQQDQPHRLFLLLVRVPPALRQNLLR